MVGQYGGTIWWDNLRTSYKQIVRCVTINQMNNVQYMISISIMNSVYGERVIDFNILNTRTVVVALLFIPEVQGEAGTGTGRRFFPPSSSSLNRFHYRLYILPIRRSPSPRGPPPPTPALSLFTQSSHLSFGLPPSPLHSKRIRSLRQPFPFHSLHLSNPYNRIITTIRFFTPASSLSFLPQLPPSASSLSFSILCLFILFTPAILLTHLFSQLLFFRLRRRLWAT